MSNNQNYSCVIAYQFENNFVKQEMTKVDSMVIQTSSGTEKISIDEYLENHYSIGNIRAISGGIETISLSSYLSNRILYVKFYKSV